MAIDCPGLGQMTSDGEPGFSCLKGRPQVDPSFSLRSVSGARRLPHEPDGCPPAQLGHEHLGTDHLPAGHFPGLGAEPLSQCDSTVILCGQPHLSDPLSPPWRCSWGWTLPEGSCHHLLLGSRRVIQYFSVIQSVCSELGHPPGLHLGQQAHYVAHLLLSHALQGPDISQTCPPEKQAPLFLSWHFVRMEENPILVTIADLECHLSRAVGMRSRPSPWAQLTFPTDYFGPYSGETVLPFGVTFLAEAGSSVQLSSCPQLGRVLLGWCPAYTSCLTVNPAGPQQPEFLQILGDREGQVTP